MPPLTLYATPLSANGRKVLAAAHHLGLDAEIRLVNVYRGEGRTPDYLAVNPTGKIPLLVEDGFLLTESNAILQHLAEVHGGFRLSSHDPRDRARIASWLFWEAAHWQPTLIPFLAPLVGHLLLPEAVPAPAGEPDWASAPLQPLLAHLEARLDKRPFLAGDAPTIADFAVGGMTTYFRAAGFPFVAWPRFAAWHARLERLDAWRATAMAPWK
jgi:glutathione S-transferase